MMKKIFAFISLFAFLLCLAGCAASVSGKTYKYDSFEYELIKRVLIINAPLNINCWPKYLILLKSISKSVLNAVKHAFLISLHSTSKSKYCAMSFSISSKLLNLALKKQSLFLNMILKIIH